ncbi:FAD-dependent monooxygenase [Streptomyces showdoensis]|uniref:FAD-dependent monooxygenase n=1 Tax=Streptomyces showdoensis TaxID=68268 RepID=UPI003CD077E5
MPRRRVSAVAVGAPYDVGRGAQGHGGADASAATVTPSSVPSGPVRTAVASVYVLVVGAGPCRAHRGAPSCAGAARGVRIVERLPARLPYAKAVGIQPRTPWRSGTGWAARGPRGAAVRCAGSSCTSTGRAVPPGAGAAARGPYRFAALPQYETERILEEFLAGFGTRIERDGTRVVRAGRGRGDRPAPRDPDGGPPAEEELRCRYLVGCDGAHSTVRKQLGLGFEGGAFPRGYCWATWRSTGPAARYGVRSTRRGPDGPDGPDGRTDDVLVCIPLPGNGRYRVSMNVPPELSAAQRATGGRGRRGPRPGRRRARAGTRRHPAGTGRLSPRRRRPRPCAVLGCSGSVTGCRPVRGMRGFVSRGRRRRRTSIRPPARRA